jgi:hypothetical protein
MPDTSELFKSGDLLAPSSAEINIAFTTAGAGTLATTQLGTIATLQTGAAFFNKLTLPSFSGKTGKSLQQALVVPEKSKRVGVFNSADELECVLSAGAIVRLKALNSTAAGTPIMKIGQGMKRWPWPLDGDTYHTSELNTSAWGTNLSTFSGGTANEQAVALSSTLAVTVWADSNNDIYIRAFSRNADGSHRGESLVTTLRSNANTLVYPQVIKLSSTFVVVQWVDTTATAKLEWIACEVADGATPTITIGAVRDDTAITSADRILNSGNNQGFVADFNSASNSAFWVNGPMVSTTGAKAYRLSVNTGTRAITLDHSFTYAGSSYGGVFHRGCSPAADRFLVPEFIGSSRSNLTMLQYSAGSISELWSTTQDYWVLGRLNNGNTSLEVVDAASGLILFRGDGVVFSTTQTALLRIPNYATSSGIRMFAVMWLANVFGTVFNPGNRAFVLIEGEMVVLDSQNGRGMASTDLLNVEGSSAGDTNYYANRNPWEMASVQEFVDYNATNGSPSAICVDEASRRIWRFAYQTVPISGNMKIHVSVHAWPKR